MSAPAANALSPAPVKITPRTSASSRASSKAALQFRKDCLIQRIEHLGPVEGYIGDGPFFS